jgi:hypothetical protein
MSTNYSYSRLISLTDYLFSHPCVPTLIHPEIFIPPGPSPPPLPAPVHIILSNPNKNLGLCKREVWSYRIFLRDTDFGWLYRAIDDTWISPDNLIEFIGDLVDVVDPMTDIVIKGCKNFRSVFGCAPWLDGGIGWLLSRAAVMHILE